MRKGLCSAGRATRVRQWRRKVPLQRADDAYDSSDRIFWRSISDD